MINVYVYKNYNTFIITLSTFKIRKHLIKTDNLYFIHFPRNELGHYTIRMGM